MLKRSLQKFPKVSDNENVIIRIPSEDRSKCDFQNLIGVILGIEDDLFVVGCRAGWIKEKFGRNGFEKFPTNFLTPEDVPKKWVELRSAATLAFINGKAQGMFKCNCKKSCRIGRCKCRASGYLCNSKCHHSNTCDNKHDFL